MDKSTNAPELDPQRQARAKEYARLSRRAYVAGLALSAIVMVLALVVNPARAIVAFTGGAAMPYLPVALYFVLLLVVFEVVQLPLSIYTGYTLPHRFDLSVETFGAWVRDQLKGSAIGLVFGLILLEVVYSLLANFPTYWWLIAAAVMLLFTVVMANLSPILIAPLFYKFRPLADEELARRLSDLAERAGARVRGVYVMDMSRRTRAANAALMGLGNTRRIVLGDTLLDNYPPDEIEVILAHELGHHAHGDIVKGIAVNTGVTLLSFWLADLALGWGAAQLGLTGLADPAGLPLLGVVLGAVSLLAMPLTNGFTRAMEANADRYALETTGKPQAFLASMIRLANQNLADAFPPRWVEVLLYDHPSIGDRLAMARSYMKSGR